MRIKKSLSILCVVGIVVSILTSSAFALKSNPNTHSDEQIFPDEPELNHEQLVEQINADPYAITVNEYDLYLQQRQLAEMILTNPSTSEIDKEMAKDIINFDPAAEINFLQKKSDDELLKSGFSKDRIEKIRSFDGSETELRALSANLTVSATNKCTKNASGYWAKVAMSFYWDDIPIVQKRDAMIASASTGFMAEKVADTKAHVNYVASYNPDYKYTKYFDGDDMVINPFGDGNIAGFSFEFNENSYKAMSGTAVLVFLSTNTNRVSLSFGYAHANSQITASLGIDFTSSGISAGMGFGLSDKYTVVAKAFDAQTIS